MEPVTISITGAARALGLGRTSIYTLLDEGRLESVKIGRRRLIKTASIKRLIDGEASVGCETPGGSVDAQPSANLTYSRTPPKGEG